MANKDFVAAIGNFTDTLDEIVDILKKQVDNESESEFQQFFSDVKEQTKAALDIVNDIKSLKSDNKKIKSDTKEILRIVKSIKNTKSTSSNVIDDFSNSKQSIAQGASTIVLMAGSILAIGTAFSILNDVDFETVAALSLSIPILAKTFSEISKDKSLNPLTTASISASVIIMAGAITIAGHFLSSVPEFSLNQGLSIIAISGAMGLSLWTLSKAADDIGVFDAAKVLMLASTMPMVALGLNGAAMLINNIPTIDVAKGLTAVVVAGAMGLAMWGISKAANGMNISDIGNVIALALVMPLVAGGLYLSGLTLQNFPKIENPLEIATGALGIAAGIGATALAIKGMLLLGLDENPDDTLIGTGLMPVIAGALMASSWVLSLGKWTDGPSVEWAQSFGLLMLASIPSVTILGGIASTGVGALVIGAGILAMGTIAGGLVATSHIIATGNWKSGPSPDWAEGTGKSLMYFVQAMTEAAPGVTDFLVGNTMSSKIDGLKMTAKAMVEVANVLASSGAQFKNGPGKDWAEGTGLALISFIKAMDDIGEGKLESMIKGIFGGNMNQKMLAITSVAQLMIQVNTILAEANAKFNTGPSKSWAEGTGGSLISFAKAMQDVDGTGGVFDFVDKIFNGDKLQSIRNIAATIAEVSLDIATGSYNIKPDENWGNNIANTIKSIAGIGDLSDDLEDSIASIKMLNTNAADITKTMLSLNTALGGGQNITKTSTDLERLANAYNTLAGSIANITGALSNTDISKIPAASNISASLLTISLINNEALSKNIQTLSTSSDKIKSIFSKISGTEPTQNINEINKIKKDISDPDPIKINEKNNIINENNPTVENKSVNTNPYENVENILKTIQVVLEKIEQSVTNIEDLKQMDGLSLNPISH